MARCRLCRGRLPGNVLANHAECVAEYEERFHTGRCVGCGRQGARLGMCADTECAYAGYPGGV